MSGSQRVNYFRKQLADFPLEFDAHNWKNK